MWAAVTPHRHPQYSQIYLFVVISLLRSSDYWNEGYTTGGFWLWPFIKEFFKCSISSPESHLPQWKNHMDTIYCPPAWIFKKTYTLNYCLTNLFLHYSQHSSVTRTEYSHARVFLQIVVAEQGRFCGFSFIVLCLQRCERNKGECFMLPFGCPSHQVLSAGSRPLSPLCLFFFSYLFSFSWMLCVQEFLPNGPWWRLILLCTLCICHCI